MPLNKPVIGGYPVRPKEEIIAAGGSLAEEPSCAPPPSVSGNREVLGCQAWPTCRFSNATMGNFKGSGPRKVAYFYHTIEGLEKTDECPCHQFIRGGLQSAMDDGLQMALRGERHETVRIIAQEGEPYWTMKREHVFPKDGKTPPYWAEPKRVQVTCGRASEIVPAENFPEYNRSLSDEYLRGVVDSVPPPAAPPVVAVKVEK